MAASMTNKLSARFHQIFKEYYSFNSVTAIQIRHRHKVNIKHPWPGPLERQVVVAITNPIVPQIKVDPTLTCTRRSDLPNAMDSVNEYERFLMQNQKKLLDDAESGVIAFCHQTALAAKAYRRNLVNLQNNGFTMTRVNRKVFAHSVKDSKYETLNMILGFSTIMITHREPQVADLLGLLKKIPELHLLCAVVEGGLLSKTQVEEYANLPTKDILLGQTCALLDQPAQRLSRLLTSGQEQFTRNLTSYIKQK